MAILPWDDWFYHLSKEKECIDNLYNQYTNKRDLIAIKGQSYNYNLGQYQAMTVYNTSLLIANQDGNFNDSTYAQWLQLNLSPPRIEADGSEVAKAFQVATSAAGTYLVGIGIKRFAGNCVKPAIKSAYRSIAEKFGSDTLEPVVEDVADQGVESGISAAVEETSEKVIEDIGDSVGKSAARSIIETLTLDQVGNLALAGGIFAAVGLDAILGAIDGAKEKDALDKQKNKLETALDKVNTFLAKLEKAEKQLEEAIHDSQAHFIQVIQILSKIQEPVGYKWNYVPGMKNLSNFSAAMQNAVNQYGILSKIRHDWFNMKKNQPTLTWSLFKMVEDMQRSPTLSKEQFEEYLNYVADHSNDMKAARDQEKTAVPTP